MGYTYPREKRKQKPIARLEFGLTVTNASLFYYSNVKNVENIHFTPFNNVDNFMEHFWVTLFVIVSHLQPISARHTHQRQML